MRNTTDRMKFLLIIIITALSIYSTYAQSKFSLGIDAGVRIEKPIFNDPKGYVIRNLLPNNPYGISATYQANEKWGFELGLYRIGFYRNANVYYNEPGYQPIFKHGSVGAPFLSTLQIPARVIYGTGLGFSHFSLNVFSGLNLYHQVHPFDLFGITSGSGTPVFPDGAPQLMFTETGRVIERTSVGIEMGLELKYQLSKSISLAYRFSGILGTRDKIFNEGSYFLEENPQDIYSFDYVQNGTSLNHFLSIRFRLEKKSKTRDNKYD